MYFSLLLLALLILSPGISVAQYSPVHTMKLTERDRIWGSYGVDTRTYTSYSYTPETRYVYAANSQPNTEGWKYLWDRTRGRWELAAEWDCKGDLVDYWWGQPRFLCNCGMFGGVSYQTGKCKPNIPPF